MKTVILCGGKGTRAYPHTIDVPKPLLECLVVRHGDNMGRVRPGVLLGRTITTQLPSIDIQNVNEQCTRISVRDREFLMCLQIQSQSVRPHRALRC